MPAANPPSPDGRDDAIVVGRYDVIVVLGAKLTAAGRPTRAIRRRVRHAVGLFRGGVAENMLMSGGAHVHPSPEAEIMRTLAMEAGVPGECIVLEGRSTRTLENAAFSMDEMEKRGWRRALVVTDVFHLPRALFTFRRLGAAVAGSGAPGIWADMTLKRIVLAWVREMVAFAAYAALFLSGRAKRVVGRGQGR